jgi:hypothetical protein
LQLREHDDELGGQVHFHTPGKWFLQFYYSVVYQHVNHFIARGDRLGRCLFTWGYTFFCCWLGPARQSVRLSVS